MEVRSGNYSFGIYVKILTVFKTVSAVNKAISIDSNRGTETLKLGKTKCIGKLEIVLYGFRKDEPPVRKTTGGSGHT